MAERSEQRRLERKYSKTAEDLKNVKEVLTEQPALDSSTSCKLTHHTATIPANNGAATRSISSYLDPLPPRLPKEGTIYLPRPPLARSQSASCTFDYESLLARHNANASASTVQGPWEAPIKTVYSYNNVWESQKGNFRGLGRHTMSVDADPEEQMSHLHRTMSDLTPRMLQQLGDFKTSGTEPSVWNTYQKSRTESMTSFASSNFSANLVPSHEYLDAKRRVTVNRGFTPGLISPSSSSSVDEESCHYRKDSTVSMTSVSTDGQPRHHRRKSRQCSMPVSDSSATSPLTTITETPDAPDKPQEKKERPCEFEKTSNNESAVASSASSDEGTWMNEYKAAEHQSQLSKQIERSVRETRNVQHFARPCTRSGEPLKPRQAGKANIDRSRTVKHLMRPAVRRAHSPKRGKGRPAAFKTPAFPATLEQANRNEPAVLETVRTKSITNLAQDAPTSSTGSEEAGENPTDLSQYMEKVRLKRSSKGPCAKNNENGDDGASFSSSSTAKTLVPMVKKMVDALPIRGRQRSTTAFRVPPALCQPPNKAEGARPEASQATAQ